MLKREQLLDSLRAAGLRQGDVAMIQSALWLIGPVEAKNRADLLEFYLTGIREVVGPEGTIAVFTLFTDYGRYGTPFVRESTPSQGGVFSEYVRTRPGAVRSAHPIVSITALGPHAEEICGGPHYNGYSYDSPWTRLVDLDAKIVALGQGLGIGERGYGATSIVHYIEHLYGVPYQYTKIYTAPVYADGEQLAGPFTMSVRYLDYRITPNYVDFRRRLVDDDIAALVPIGKGLIFLTPARRIVEEGIKALRKNRYAFLLEPPAFRQGELPMDAPTGEMQVVYDQGEAVET